MKRVRPVFSAGELRQLRLFFWVLLILNAFILGVGLILGRAGGEEVEAGTLMLAVAILVNGAFALIVGVDVAWVWIRRRRRGGRPNGTFPEIEAHEEDPKDA